MREREMLRGTDSPAWKKKGYASQEKYLEARKREKIRARERRKEAGICIQCGKKKAKAGHTRCSACLKKCRERERIKTIRKIVEGKA